MNRRTVTRLRGAPGGHDSNGDPVSSTVARLDITECLVAPRYESETLGLGRNGVVVGLNVYAPTGTDLVYTDRIEVDGIAYDIEGEPGDWQGSQVGGVEVALRRAVG